MHLESKEMQVITEALISYKEVLDEYLSNSDEQKSAEKHNLAVDKFKICNRLIRTFAEVHRKQGE